MRSCIEKLLKCLGKKGPIFVYGQFEGIILNSLAAQFPDLADSIESIIRRLVNLLPHLRKYYYHPKMKGSWSIKKVLPTVAPELNYENLEGIKNGRQAQAGYFEATASGISKERKNEIKKQLLEYCKMDTLSLVKCMEFFESGGK
jgi:hypothetical protein